MPAIHIHTASRKPLNGFNVLPLVSCHEARTGPPGGMGIDRTSEERNKSTRARAFGERRGRCRCRCMHEHGCTGLARAAGRECPSRWAPAPRSLDASVGQSGHLWQWCPAQDSVVASSQTKDEKAKCQPFVSLVYYHEKYCSLVYYKRKILLDSC
jgi:hypothetical protein